MKIIGKMKKTPGRIWNYDDFLASIAADDRRDIESGRMCPECGRKTSSRFVCQPCQQRGV